MDLVDKNHFAVAESELILGVYQNEPTLCGNFSATLKKSERIFLHLLIDILLHDTLGYDLVA